MDLKQLIGDHILTTEGYSDLIQMMVARSLPKDMPEHLWREINQEILSRDTLVGAIERSWRRHFTAEEIEDILKFYGTTAGQKMAKVNVLSYQEMTAELEFIFKQRAPAVFERFLGDLCGERKA